MLVIGICIDKPTVEWKSLFACRKKHVLKQVKKGYF